MVEKFISHFQFLSKFNYKDLKLQHLISNTLEKVL